MRAEFPPSQKRPRRLLARRKFIQHMASYFLGRAGNTSRADSSASRNGRPPLTSFCVSRTRCAICGGQATQAPRTRRRQISTVR